MDPAPSPQAPTPYSSLAPPPTPPSGMLAAATSGTPPPAHLRGLIMQKEKELHDINEYRIHTLENLLQEKDRDVAEGKTKLAKLKEDFTYNLKLLEERDGELERYDGSFTHLKAVLRDREIELSEVKISAAELQHAAKQERDRAAESEAYYQQKLAATREEGEASRWKLDDELRTQRDEFEGYKREQARQAREASEALERERREAATAFDDAARAREREHGAKVEEHEAELRQARQAKARAEAATAEAKSHVMREEEKLEALAAQYRSLERQQEEEGREASR